MYNCRNNKQIFKNTDYIVYSMLYNNHSFEYYEPDSFEQDSHSEAQMQNQHAPSAIPNNIGSDRKKYAENNQKLNNYPNYYNQRGDGSELTFKKENQFRSLRAPQGANFLSHNLLNTYVQNPENKPRQKLGSTKRQNYTNADMLQEQTQQKQFLAIIKKGRSITQIISTIKNSKDVKLLKFMNQNELNKILSLAQQEQRESIDEIAQLKIKTIIAILSYLNLRKKRINIKLTIQLMKNDLENRDRQILFTQADKRKLELLGLLAAQLDKKIFIQGLKYNKMYQFCYQVLSQIEDIPDDEQNNSIQNRKIQYTQQQESLFNNKFIKESKSQAGTNKNRGQFATPIVENHYQQPKRLAIFSQIVGSFFNKTIYPIFRAIKNTQFQGHNHALQDDNQFLEHHSRDPNESQNYDQQDQHQPNVQQAENSENQDPIKAISDYIETLKDQLIPNPTHKQEIMKNYFLKWKIYFLRNIIQKIQQQQVKHPQQYNSTGKYLQAQQQQQQQQQIQPNFNINNNINTNKNVNTNTNINEYASHKSNKSLKSTDETDLKQQKFKLKQFIYRNRMRNFYRLIRDLRASRKINQVMDRYYRKNLVKKCFQSFVSNHDQEAYQRWREVYCMDVAENQNQQQAVTAQIFYETNCIAKYFFHWKNQLKLSKFIQKVQQAEIKSSFNRIKSHVFQQIGNQTKLTKYLERKRRQNLFKYYNIIKNQTSFSDELKNKAQGLQSRKNLEILQVCFSAISLEWKKQMLLQRKVQKIVSINLIKQFYQKFRVKTVLRQQQQTLQLKAKYVVMQINKQKVIKKFQQNYMKALINKRLQVRQTKLQIFQATRKAQIGLNQWHRNYLRHKNYEVIQNKLQRLKKLQQKQKLFKIWHNRLIDKYREKKKGKLTTNHKIWLNKYFQKLCQIQQQQIK